MFIGHVASRNITELIFIGQPRNITPYVSRGSPRNISLIFLVQPMNIRFFLFFLPILSASSVGEPLKPAHRKCSIHITIQYHISSNESSRQTSQVCNITSIQRTPPLHINIETSLVLESTAHSTGSLCSAPPPSGLSTVQANSSLDEASRCESKTSKT
jgi:hypothetical protein